MTKSYSYIKEEKFIFIYLMGHETKLSVKLSHQVGLGLLLKFPTHCPSVWSFPLLLLVLNPLPSTSSWHDCPRYPRRKTLSLVNLSLSINSDRTRRRSNIDVELQYCTWTMAGWHWMVVSFVCTKTVQVYCILIHGIGRWYEYIDVNPSNGKLLLFDSRMVHWLKRCWTKLRPEGLSHFGC